MHDLFRIYAMYDSDLKLLERILLNHKNILDSNLKKQYCVYINILCFRIILFSKLKFNIKIYIKI